MTLPVPDDTRAAAKELIRLGWAPVPVPRSKKRPVLKEWQKARFTEEEVRGHFSSDQNVGLLTGEPSGGLIDVDLDCSEALALAPFFLPPTRMQSGRSSRPQSHRWYVVDLVPEYSVFKDIDNKTVLLELRGSGRQTLVCPSIHPSGEMCIWHDSLQPSRVATTDLKLAVHRLAATTLLSRHWPSIPGSRHAIANAVAGMLLRADWTEKEVADFVIRVAEVAGDEEARSRGTAALATARTILGGREATGAPKLSELIDPAVVGRVREWLGIGQKRVADEMEWNRPIPFTVGVLPKFPIDLLPGWLADYTHAEATATQTPAALTGSLVLAACAVGLAGRVRVSVRPGWEEPTNLFVVVVLDPGNRKTAVFSDVTAPIKEHEQDQVKLLGPGIREAETRRRLLTQRAKTAERKAAKAGPADRESLEREALAAAEELSQIIVPPYPRLFADDITPEKLSERLSAHGGSFSVLSAEGGLFDVIAGRYARDNSPNLDVFLKGHSGDALRVDRLGRPPDCVDKPALTIALTVQGSVLRSLASKPMFRGRGLLARFLYSIPESPLGCRQIGAPPVPDDVREAYDTGVSRLLSIEPATDAKGRPASHVCHFDSEARRVFEKFETNLEPQLGSFGEYGSMTDWGAKLAGAIARLAGLIHFAQHLDHPAPWTDPVSENTVARAINLGRYYAAHARAAFAEMGADPEVENARHVLNWVTRHRLSSFSQRDAFQGTKGRFSTVADLRPALHLLVDHEYLREHSEPKPKGPGRRPGPRYAVNPNFENIENIGERSQNLILSNSSSSDSETTAESHPQYPHNPQNSSETPPDLTSESPSQNSQYPQKPEDGENDLDEEVVL